MVVISEKEIDCDGGGWKFAGSSSAKVLPRDDEKQFLGDYNNLEIRGCAADRF